ncbi:MAG: DUF1810 domain-containing protein [Methylocella sp.]
MANERLLRLKTGAIDETRELFGIFIYLWVLLSLVSLHKALVLNDESLIYHQGFALINALALAKVVLVAEYFHVGDTLKNRPLIYPIMFKSAVFAVILLCFHMIEETLIGVLHGKTLSQSIPNIGGGKLQGILMVGIIMFVVLMPFFAFRELGRAIGTEQLRSLLFGGETKADAVPPMMPGSAMAEIDKNDHYNLQRFVDAQRPVFEEVCVELQEGSKKGHWMWFIFPQIEGLGDSQLARKFAISSRKEAEAYLNHPILGPRLRHCTRLITLVEGRSIDQIFGDPDDLKFHSSMTLFASATSDNQVFRDALHKYFGGEPDRLTLERL